MLNVFYAVVPILWLIVLSIEPIEDYWSASKLLVPSHATIENYINLLFHSPFPRWLANTLIVSTSSSILSSLICTVAAYAFVFHKIKGKEILFALALLPVLVPLQTLIVPLFLIFTYFNLINTYYALILPYSISAFGIYFMRAYIASSIHPEIIDSARVDGASELVIFFKIILPMITPALLTLIILGYINTSNSFLWPLVAVQTEDMFTVNVGLSLWAKTIWNLQKYLPLTISGAILSMFVVVVIYAFAQKYYIGGITLTVKG
jgi:ABC-type glycerol-3-phosphate transport system permease component